jgi:hypothetical protein
MKKLLCILSLTLFAAPVIAQDQKELPALGVIPFYSDSSDQIGISMALYEAVTRRLVQSGQFRIIDIPKRKDSNIEMKKTRRREFIKRDIVEAGKNTPAEFLLIGFIRNAEIFDMDSQVVHVRVDFEVKYIDVKTAEVIEAQDFTGTSLSEQETIKEAGKKVLGFLSRKSKGETEVVLDVTGLLDASVRGKVIDAIDNSADELHQWVTNTSQSGFYFLDRNQDTTREETKTILIEGGRNLGLEKGMKLKVVKDEILTGVRGNNVLNEETIAELKIVEVRSQTAVCKVQKSIETFFKDIRKPNIRIVFKLD